jgi:integrase
MADVNLRTVQELLGHTDPKITTRYAHLSSEIKAAAVQKLAQGRRLHLVEVDSDLVASKN